MIDKRLLVYAVFLLILNLVVWLTPILAFNGYDVKGIYSFFSYLDHQYIYRSICMFKGEPGFSIEACIPHGKTGIVETRFIDFGVYNGPFVYNKEDVGRIRADVVYRDGKVGVKLPVCARDTGFYLGLLLAIFLYPLIFEGEEEFGLLYLILAAVPIGVDGGLQLLTSYESNVETRFLTGLLSGIMLSFIIIGNYLMKKAKD